MAQHHDFKVKNGLVVADSGTFGNTITGTNAVFTGSVSATNILDSSLIEQLIDSAYIQAKTTAGTDSATVISLIESANDSDSTNRITARVHRITSLSELDTLATHTGLGVPNGTAKVGDIAYKLSPFDGYVLTNIAAPAAYQNSGFHVQTNNGTVTRMFFDVVPSGQLPSDNFAIGSTIAINSGGGDVRTVTAVSDTGGNYGKGYLDFTPSDGGYAPGWDNKTVWVSTANQSTWQTFGIDSAAFTGIVDSDYVRLQTRIGDSDIDFGSNKILYSNVYTAESDLPSASDYHGMFAHVHGTGAGYFAHAGNWVKLANYSDINPYSDAHVTTLVDSAYIALRDRFQDSAGISAIVDSAYVQARQTSGGGGGGGGVDSAATITLINSVIDSVGPSRAFTYTYTATANQTTFTGADNNSNTLAYSTGNIITFLNGILLIDSDDYAATTGSSIVLNSPAGLNDILNVVKFRASGSGGNLSHEQYKYTVSSPTTTFSGNDDKGNSLSYETGELQVFLNGILLIDSQDYTASNGTSVVLTAATDSNDVLAISKYIGGGSGGGGGSGDAFRATHFVYTTAAPTTTITGADDNSTTLSYIENQIQVFQNGILLIDSADYTATNGTSIVLGSATDSDDTVVITAFRGVISGGLDSADVLAIAGSGGGGGTDSATVIALSGELKGGMFRINPQSLSINTTIDSAENAHVAGPISFDSGVVLTINGNLVIS